MTVTAEQENPRSAVLMMNGYLKALEDQVCAWPGVSAEPHRFGGRGFRLGKIEVGHMHNDGAVEIPFTRSFRDQLLKEGLAEKHRYVPDSGWVTFYVRKENDIQHAAWLLRLSYLRFALKAVPDPGKRFEQESERLGLNPQLRALLARYVPGRKSIAA